jgi:hypothetical protein
MPPCCQRYFLSALTKVGAGGDKRDVAPRPSRVWEFRENSGARARPAVCSRAAESLLKERCPPIKDGSTDLPATKRDSRLNASEIPARTDVVLALVSNELERMGARRVIAVPGRSELVDAPKVIRTPTQAATDLFLTWFYPTIRETWFEADGTPLWDDLDEQAANLRNLSVGLRETARRECPPFAEDFERIDDFEQVAWRTVLTAIARKAARQGRARRPRSRLR